LRNVGSKKSWGSVGNRSIWWGIINWIWRTTSAYQEWPWRYTKKDNYPYRALDRHLYELIRWERNTRRNINSI